MLQTESTLAKAADRAEVDEKTARKYRDSDSLPSQRRVPHTCRAYASISAVANTLRR